MADSIVSHGGYVLTRTETGWLIWDRQGKGKRQVVYIPFSKLNQAKSAIDSNFHGIHRDKLNWKVLAEKGFKKPEKLTSQSYRGYWYSQTTDGWLVFRKKDGSNPVTRRPLNLTHGELHKLIDNNFEGYPASIINWTQVIIRGDLRKKLMAVQNVPLKPHERN